MRRTVLDVPKNMHEYRTICLIRSSFGFLSILIFNCRLVLYLTIIKIILEEITMNEIIIAISAVLCTGFTNFVKGIGFRIIGIIVRENEKSVSDAKTISRIFFSINLYLPNMSFPLEKPFLAYII